MSFDELLSHPGVEEVLELRSPFGFMAYHGGSLEEMTDVIAAAAAERAGASYYGVLQPSDLQWHIPSTKVDPAHSEALRAFVDHVDVVVTVHGYGREGFWATLLLGGGNRALAEHVGGHLRTRLPAYDIATDLDRIPSELRGLHPQNPVNLPDAGRRPARAAAPGAGHEPAVVGLGGPRPDPSHPGADRRPGRIGPHVGGLRAQGESRSIPHPPLVRVYRKRSWRRLGRPCQNSITSGTTR